MKILAALLITLTINTAHAQVGVALSSTASDQIGSRLAYEIREGIRRSAGMTLVDDKNEAAVRVYLVTMNPDEERSQNWTVYSVVYTVMNVRAPSSSVFVNHFVGTCGSGRVSACASGVVATADEIGTEFKKVLLRK